MASLETMDNQTRWLLLIHQLPAKPAYQRVKTWRRLQSLGAVAIKHAVHALPAGEQAQEDFEWLLREIRDGGGEALICEARLVDGLSDEEVQAMFNAARGADYDALAREARELGEAPDRPDLRTRLARLKASVGQTVAIDFFGANGRETVDGLIAGIEAQLGQEDAMGQARTGVPLAAGGLGALKNRVWVTRQGVYVDRIASAWLIRRFIDPDARFRFVRAKGHVPQDGELRFDMFEAEFTHEGDRCTFEVLLDRLDPERHGADRHRRDRARHRPEGRKIRPAGDRRHRTSGHRPVPGQQGRCTAADTRRRGVR